MGLKTLLGRKPPIPDPAAPAGDLRSFSTASMDTFDADDPYVQIYNASIMASQGGQHDNTLKRLRFFAMAQLAEQAIQRFPSLDLAECGCWLGHSTQILGRLMLREDSRGGLHVFDSFEGLSEFQPEDAGANSPTDTAAMRGHFKSNFAAVSRHLSDFQNLTLYQGWIPTRFPEVEDRRFGFVSVDVDLFEPTRDAVSFFYPRLEIGGIMYFDDYGSGTFPGARRAIDAALVSAPPSFFMRMPYGSAFLIK